MVRYLLEQFQCVKVIHVFREANRCTDNLARAGCSFLGKFVVLDSPPTDDLYNILNADAADLYTLSPSARMLFNCTFATSLLARINYVIFYYTFMLKEKCCDKTLQE